MLGSKLDVKETITTPFGASIIYNLRSLEKRIGAKISRLPFSIRILLENVLRNYDGEIFTSGAIEQLANWNPQEKNPGEVPFMPARVLMQDFTGVPVIVDLAAMRDAMQRKGGDAMKVNPFIPVELVIDHSVQVDSFGSRDSFLLNIGKEYDRNSERYALLKWAQNAFANLRVVPPGKGIVHQVNLEYLAKVIYSRKLNGELMAYPDTVLGTDSHTTMVNGMGVLGWGVGGIEAEAAMLGQPYYMLTPKVVGFRLSGKLREGTTATDLVLTITQMLRRKNVVGSFVEFFGPGLSELSVPDRATIANMAPEYGATVGFFPIDETTLAYLRNTGRDERQVQLVKEYSTKVGLFRINGSEEIEYSDILELDLHDVEATVAGPSTPEQKVPLSRAKEVFTASLRSHLAEWQGSRGSGKGGQIVTTELTPPRITIGGEEMELNHGSIVIAAITSCTNTSNPSVMLGAGLLAKKAVERGLKVKPYVKTSLAPGSRVVIDYLEAADLLRYLEALGFNLVGFGCTTCIGNSGPLPEPVAQAVDANRLYVAAVLSGNRNFEARIHPQVRANFLASPLLIVAYALAGRMDLDLTNEPLGMDHAGKPVFLRDIWPTQKEIAQAIETSIRPTAYTERYADIFRGDDAWEKLKAAEAPVHSWQSESTYIREPPYFKEVSSQSPATRNIEGAYVLALLGDMTTTDHISPAGSIAQESPAGKHLMASGVAPGEFNTYGSRRGNHEVMIRGTFANVRLRNMMVKGTEGGWTVHVPSGEKMSIYDAAVRYAKESSPLLVIAGKQYGAGSSRDWAAKGTSLLGVKAVIAQDYERIHRANLVGMGVLPLQFETGESASSLQLTGFERYSISGLEAELKPQQKVTVKVKRQDGSEAAFTATARLDTPVEVNYYKHGGILQYVFRQLQKN